MANVVIARKAASTKNSLIFAFGVVVFRPRTMAFHGEDVPGVTRALNGFERVPRNNMLWQLQ